VTNRALLIAIAASGLVSAPAAAKQGPLAQAVGAPDNLVITATVRARVEGIDGQFRPNIATGDSMLSLRTAIAAEYDAGPVRFGAEMWDARAYGQAINSSAGTGEVNALELVQAYVRAELGDWSKGAKGGKGLLTAGRFTMDIGSRRLVARNRFRNTTNSFTGANLDWTTGDGKRLQAFYTLPQIRLPDDAQGIRDNRVKWDSESTALQFYGADVTIPKVLGGTVEAYAFGLAERDTPTRLTRNRRIGTVGARLYAKPQAGKWDHDTEAAYQFGKVRRSTGAADLADVDVSAWFAHGEVGYTFEKGWHPRAAVLMDGVSGDGGKPGKYGRFDTLFGSRRFDFGPTALYGALSRANIVSPGLRLELTPSKRTDGGITYRALWLEDSRDSFSNTGVKDATGKSGRFAGHQIDARVRTWIVPDLLQAETGAAFLFKHGVLRNAPNAPATGNTAYGYLDLTLSL